MKMHGKGVTPKKLAQRGQVMTLCGRDVDPQFVTTNPRLVTCTICSKAKRGSRA